jgi:hypothetical protein
MPFLLAAVTLGGPALAHPVAFKGAASFMAFNQPDMQDWQLLYSFERQFSLGVDFIRDTMSGPERFFLIPRLSWLVNRWNGPDYQANIYVYGGAGSARVNGSFELAGEAALEADYETRETYLSAKASTAFGQHLTPLTVYQARAGFAPYLASFDGLHSWLILQAQYFPGTTNERLRIGPVLRFFYRNVLWELGVSARGTGSFNFMVHF